jgi:hypothetical protein
MADYLLFVDCFLWPGGVAELAEVCFQCPVAFTFRDLFSLISFSSVFAVLF